MQARKKRLDQLKNAAMVVLFFTTILLLYLTWRDRDARAFHLSGILDFISQDVWVPEAEEFLDPQYAVLGFGDATFSVEREGAGRLLEDITGIFARISKDATFVVSEVTPEQYREMLTDYASVRIALPCAIPFAEFCERNGVAKDSAFETVESAESIIVTAAAPESLFAERAGKCWRVEPDTASDSYSSVLDGLLRTGATFYTAGSILGNGNMSVLPLAFSAELEASEWKNVSQEEAEEAGRKVAESIFGENFDFVRRISDSFGTVTYMYGYGEKTLTCYRDGAIEYKTELKEGQDPGFYASLESAAAFVASHGGWGSERRELRFSLCRAETSGSGRNRVYSFEFEQLLDAHPLRSEDGPAVTVRLCGGEVSYCRQRVIRAFAEYGEEKPAADAANVLAGNCHLIHSVMQGSVLSESSDEEFSYVAARFRQAVSGYAVTEGLLKPAWIISMEGGTDFFFGLYDGEPLGFTRD